MNTVTAQTRAEWRAWLAANHDKESEIWLVYYKKGSGYPTIDYGESVEEALCYGWVDSIIKKIDEEKYARKFTPRKNNSNWSASNIKRAEKMIKSGQMTEFGMQKVVAAKQSGSWNAPVQAPTLSFKIHPEFAAALEQNPSAKEGFDHLSPSHQKEYIGWIEVAKRSETRTRRIIESIQLLAKGEKLGLK